MMLLLLMITSLDVNGGIIFVSVVDSSCFPFAGVFDNNNDDDDHNDDDDEHDDNDDCHDGSWWLSGKFVALRPEDRRFESHSSRHIGTLGKSFTHSCL